MWFLCVRYLTVLEMVFIKCLLKYQVFFKTFVCLVEKIKLGFVFWIVNDEYKYYIVKNFGSLERKGILGLDSLNLNN